MQWLYINTPTTYVCVDVANKYSTVRLLVVLCVCVFSCSLLSATLSLFVRRTTVSRDMSQTTKVIKHQSKRERIKVTIATS